MHVLVGRALPAQHEVDTIWLLGRLRVFLVNEWPALVSKMGTARSCLKVKMTAFGLGRLGLSHEWLW